MYARFALIRYGKTPRHEITVMKEGDFYTHTSLEAGATQGHEGKHRFHSRGTGIEGDLRARNLFVVSVGRNGPSLVSRFRTGSFEYCQWVLEHRVYPWLSAAWP